MSDNCRIENLIIRYIQRDIKEDELRILDQWLEQAPENQSLFFQLKNLYDSARIAQLSSEDEGNANWKRMLSRIQEDERESLEMQPQMMTNRQSSNHWLVVLRYAAVLIFALGIGWGVSEYRMQEFVAAWEKDTEGYNVIQVEKGGRANTLWLADGSRVVLGAASTFKYPARFNMENKREVYLEGEAYFEVAPDAEKPFVVKMQKQNVTVLGTTFNIEAYRDASHSITTLLSGSVFLETFNRAGESVSCTLLKPNQRALMNNETGEVVLEDVDSSIASAWTLGVYKFKDEPLASIVEKLERHYDVTIDIEDAALGQVCYTGSFSYDQDILDVLRIINYERQFVFKQVGKQIYISRR